ncbi:hypothetical protein ACUOA8_38935, partial [Escherichia sp. SS-MK2]
MIENRPWLTIFSHTMLILGIAVILFPLYVAFVAATLDKQAVYAAPMTLIPGTYLLEEDHRDPEDQHGMAEYRQPRTVLNH